MKALTLIQPWSWAVAHAGKRVENRTWAPPASIIGQRIAIHAGKRLDKYAAVELAGDLMLRWDPSVPGHADMPAAVALDFCLKPVGDHPGFVHGAVESVGTIAGYVEESEHGITLQGIGVDEDAAVMASPWWIGPVGWVLTDVIVLPEPVPCRGAQGLWTLPEEVECAVLAQIGGAYADAP